MTDATKPEPGPELIDDPLAPSVYTVHVTHGWDGSLEIEIKGIVDNANARGAVAQALRLAAEAVEAGSNRFCRKGRKSDPNVVPLRAEDAQCLPQEEADPGLVKALADVFRMARDGQLKSFIGTGFTMDGLRMTVRGGPIGADISQMLGALAWLQHEYVARITGNAD